MRVALQVVTGDRFMGVILSGKLNCRMIGILRIYMSAGLAKGIL